MIWGWIMLQFMFLNTSWESLAMPKKRRSTDYTGSVRNFRHISGSSSSVTDWEIGLREAVLQALLRERYQDPSLRERLIRAPLIGRQDTATPFGDVAVLARGQLYGIHGGNFALVQDPYQNDCDDCYNPRRCTRHQCQPWTPHNQEQLIALWTVKRLRHRDFNNIHRYEVEYTISPVNTETSGIITRRGRFNYAIPGHVFVIRSHDVSKNTPSDSYLEVFNRKIPHKHFKPDILIGVDPAGHKHVLHSYPGFFTHPVQTPNNVNNDLKENELYNKLIDTLAAKTSTTTQREGPHTLSLNHYGGNTKPVAMTSTPMIQTSFSQMTPSISTHAFTTITVPSAEPVMPQKTTHAIQGQLLTTVHYFVPVGEEQLLTSEEFKPGNINEKTSPKPTKKPQAQNKKPSLETHKTTESTKPTKKYDKTKITKASVTKFTTTSEATIKPHVTQEKITTPTSKPKNSSRYTSSTRYSTTSTTSAPFTKSSTISTLKPTIRPVSKTTKPTTTVSEIATIMEMSTIVSTSRLTEVPAITTTHRKKKVTTPKITSTTSASTASSVQTPSTSSSTIENKNSTLKSTMPSILPTSLFPSRTTTQRRKKVTTPKITSTTSVSTASSVQTPSTSSSTIENKNLTSKSTMPSILPTSLFPSRTTTQRRKKVTAPKITSTTSVSTASSVQTPSTSSSTIENKNSTLKSTMPSILSTSLFPTTTPFFQTAVSKPTETSTSSMPASIPSSTMHFMTKIPLHIDVMVANSTDVPQYGTTPEMQFPTLMTDILITTTVGGNTVKITTETPISNQEEENPTIFSESTKPIEITSSRPSDEPEPSDQMSAPGNVTETTPYYDVMVTTTDHSTSAKKELEKTTIYTGTTELLTIKEEAITTFSNESMKTDINKTEYLPEVEPTTTVEDFHWTSGPIGADISTTKAQSDESMGYISSTDFSNRTENTETSPEIGTTMKNEEILTSIQETDYNTSSVIQVNTEKSTQNTSNVETTTKENTTRTTTQSPPKTTKKKITSSVKPTLANDFLIDAEPVEEPMHTKPQIQEIDLDDIFGTTIATIKPISTTEKPMESIFAQHLFGEKTTISNHKIIYSNFYELSTMPTPMKNEEVMTFQPLTRQSYETSISYTVNKRNYTSTTPSTPYVGYTYEVPAPGNTENIGEDVPSDDKYVNSTTESGAKKRSYSTKKAFDDLALQLVNHARSLEYANRMNRTGRAKYKRRRTYKPKIRKNTRKRKPEKKQK